MPLGWGGKKHIRKKDNLINICEFNPWGCATKKMKVEKKNITSSSASTAETGYAPPDSAFPSTKMSGRTPSWSQQSMRPVLARPVCTSSAISSAPCFFKSSWAAER